MDSRCDEFATKDCRTVVKSAPTGAGEVLPAWCRSGRQRTLGAGVYERRIGRCYSGAVLGPTDLTDPAAVAIRYVCQESAKYGFKIGIAWAPAPVPVAVHWRETKALEKLEDQIRKAMGPECASTEFSNFNDSTAYLAFDHIALHLRGIGWEQRLTSQMKSYIERALQNRRAEALTSSQRP